MYSNRDVGFALVAKLGLKEKIRYSGPQRKLKYYVGFSKAHNERKVLESFDAAYRTLHQRGVIKRILDQYDMQPASLEESGR